MKRFSWHGTSPVNLRSILKKGLWGGYALSRNFDDSVWKAAVDGTYLTDSVEVAHCYSTWLRPLSSEGIVILCSIEMSSSHIAIDEDILYYLESLIDTLNLRVSYGNHITYTDRALAPIYDLVLTTILDSVEVQCKPRVETWFDYYRDTVNAWAFNILDYQRSTKTSRFYKRRWQTVGLLSKAIGKLSGIFNSGSTLANSFAVTCPIGYAGSHRILGVWRAKGNPIVFQRIYGDTQWDDLLAYEWDVKLRKSKDFWREYEETKSCSAMYASTGAGCT